MSTSNKELITKVQLPIKPLSVNRCLRSNVNGRRFKTQEYQDYIEYIKKNLLIKGENKKTIKNKTVPLIINYKFYFPIFTKKGDRLNLRAGDCFNFIKPLEDIISNFYNFEDAQVISGSACKINSESLVTYFEIYKILNMDLYNYELPF